MSVPVLRGALLCAVALGCGLRLDASLELTVNSSLATEGYFTLSWSDSDEPIRLYESTDRDFRNRELIYQGKDTARTVTGKPDGVYFYRLSSNQDESTAKWSEIVEVEVKHHSLAHAMAYFAVGAIVFLASLGTIVVSARRGA